GLGSRSGPERAARAAAGRANALELHRPRPPGRRTRRDRARPGAFGGPALVVAPAGSARGDGDGRGGHMFGRLSPPRAGPAPRIGRERGGRDRRAFVVQPGHPRKLRRDSPARSDAAAGQSVARLAEMNRLRETSFWLALLLGVLPVVPGVLRAQDAATPPSPPLLKSPVDTFRELLA